MATAPKPWLLAIPVEIQLAICTEIVESFPFPRHRNGELPSPAPHDPNPTWKKVTLENFPALGGLARTCKALEQLTTPLLFERVQVSVFRATAFFQIIRHFSRFGHVAACVRHLTVGSAWDTSNLSASQASFLLQEGRRLGLSPLPNYPPDLASNPVESKAILVDVLLCQVPALRKLDLFLSQYLHEGVASSVLSYTTRLPDSYILGSLRHIKVHSRSPNWSANSFNRVSFTALLRHTPAVTCLQVGYCDGNAPQGIIQNLLPKLQDLHLFEGLAPDLASVAKFCPHLQRFRIEAGATASPSIGHFMSSYTAIIPGRDSALNALLPLSTTLQDLNIDGSGLAILDIRAVSDMARFSSLRSLRWIFLRWPDGDNAMLLDKLPPAIESLCLGGEDMPIYDIGVLLRERLRSGQLPGLRRFRYLLVHTELEPGMAETVARLFEGTGVDCSPASLADDGGISTEAGYFLWPEEREEGASD